MGIIFRRLMIMEADYIKNDSGRRSALGTFGELITQNCHPGHGLCPADSHANLTALPEENKHPETSAIFGLNVGECYASYSPERHCLKTLQDYLIPMEGDSSTEFCLTFTGAGMMLNGKLYRLRRSEPSTSEKGYGSSVTKKLGGGGVRVLALQLQK
jgi:hypothetical protein